MRTAYHQQLADLTTQLGEMCGLAGVAMKRATRALLAADDVAAEQVIGDHERIVAVRVRKAHRYRAIRDKPVCCTSKTTRWMTCIGSCSVC